MPAIDSALRVHPPSEAACGPQTALPVDTLGNRYHVEWDPHAPVTALGHLVFFFQFLATGHLWSEFVRGCPLVYRSNNAPEVGDVLGTWLLTTLAGASRYAHTTALMGDKVNPPALGMNRVVSEDSLRRSFEDCDEEAVQLWQAKTLVDTCRPFLQVPWICDLDVTVKTIYGKQEGAEIGYNPHKKGRPSHAYHTMFIRHVRLALDVYVQPGNRHEPVHGRQNVWRVIDSLADNEKPFLICGDANYGTSDYLLEAEERSQRYLFRMRANPAIKKLIQQVDLDGKWHPYNDTFSYQEKVVKIGKWDRPRRLIFIRKKVRESRKQEDTPLLEHANLTVMTKPEYEFAVLVTNIHESAFACVDLYHKRGDVENNYDDLKNHWGWGGFMTKDLLRCQVAARFNAIFFNWWNLFTRCAEPKRPRESVTSRPLLLHAVGQVIKSGRQTTLRLTSSHGERELAQSLLTRLSMFLSGIANTAEQLTSTERWARICAPIIAAFIGDRAVAALPSG